MLGGPSMYGQAPMGMPGGMGMSYVQPPAERGTSSTVIVLVVLLCVLLLGMGSCMMCVCAGAASQKSGSALTAEPAGTGP